MHFGLRLTNTRENTKYLCQQQQELIFIFSTESLIPMSITYLYFCKKFRKFLKARGTRDCALFCWLRDNFYQDWISSFRLCRGRNQKILLNLNSCSISWRSFLIQQMNSCWFKWCAMIFICFFWVLFNVPPYFYFRWS